MNALRAVPTPGDDPAAQARADLAPVQDLDTSVEPGYDPATDPEAMLLCALMDVRNQSADGTDIERITSTLTTADFEDPAHARMYGHIVDLIASGQPHDFASVTGALIRSGADGAKDAPLRKRLMGIVTAGAHSVAAVHYADNVLSQSYRRSFHIAGGRLAQAAEEAPEADLFDYMVELGKAQRSAFNRLNTFRQVQPSTAVAPSGGHAVTGKAENLPVL